MSWQSFQSMVRSAGIRRAVGLAMGLAVGVLAAAPLAAVGLVATASPAWAHGEKAQMPFLRMRTIQWYDLKWSTDKIDVNDTVEITGKFRVSEHWPTQSVLLPDVAFLNVGQPGPALVREATFVNGTFVPRSFSLEPGKHYDFKIVMRGRRPGRWHIHPVMSVEGGGPLSGPGEWVDVNGSMASFTNSETTLNGQAVDIETMGLGSIYMWHLFWIIVAAAWIGYWFRRGGFIGRYLRVAKSEDAGTADQMISSRDEKLALAVLAGTLLIVVFGYARATASYPNTLPLQAGLLPLAPSDPAHSGSKDVKVTMQRAVYKVPGRQLDLTVEVTNNSSEPVRIGELNMAGVRFFNASVIKEPGKYPKYLLAPEGLTVSNEKPIMPGQTEMVTFKAQDAAWDVERLADIYYGTDSSIAGLLILYSPQGTRHIVEIGGPAVPVFERV
jgi:methane/ammonia monooxygenase subunit B